MNVIIFWTKISQTFSVKGTLNKDMTKKGIISMMLAAVFMFSASGCSVSGVKTTEADTEAVKTALEKFDSCSSFTLVQLTERQETVTVDKAKQTYSGSTGMEISLITEPELRMKTVTTAQVSFDGEQIEQTNVSYIIPEGEVYTEYFSDTAKWYKVSTDDASAVASINAESVASTFCADRIDFGKAGEDELEDGRAVRYEGTLKGMELVSLLEANGHLSGVASTSANQQALIKENLAKDLDGVTVCVWVDAASGYPVRFEIDMTGILNDFEKSISKTLGAKASDDWIITQYIISMDLSDFNAVSEIVLPAETASAEPYEAEAAPAD